MQAYYTVPVDNLVNVLQYYRYFVSVNYNNLVANSAF